MKFPKFLLLISLFIFTSFSLQTATSKPHNNFTDLEALLAIKSLIADPNGILNANWTTNTTFCCWIGVQCSSRRQRVTAIRLRKLSLEGTISPHLGNLSFLSHLDISNNTLSGHIPEALSRLHRLTVLNLQVNYLSGPIPLSFAQYQDLQVLSLAYNRLTGTIPAEIGSFPKLTSLYLGTNELTGTIPNSLGNLTKLIMLDLSWNNLTGVIPRELGNLPNLQYLYLDSNNLVGQIPASLLNDSMLSFFGLNDNKLSGSVPVGIGTSLPNLTALCLSGNELIGTIPNSLGNLTKLQILPLAYNHFIGAIPTEFGNLLELNILYLDVNQLTGTIPNSLGNLTKLINLDLSFNNLTGVIPRELGNLPNLQYLHLGTNNLNGSIPVCLSNNSMLYFFNLAENRLSGSVPAGIGSSLPLLQRFRLNGNQLTGGLRFLLSLSNCKGLQYVSISVNKLEGALPNSIGNLSTSLQILFIDVNNITGNIPVGLGNLTGLIALSLQENELTGTIPSSLTRLHNLQGLFLTQNRISGLIPFEIGLMKNLGTLEIHNNALSGPIPDSIANNSMLQHLLLGNNQLSSSIPQSLWALQNLLELNLSVNTLSGLIPLDVRNLKSLDTLDLSMNHLSGDISSALGRLQMLTYLDLSRNSFQGEIPETLNGLISITYLNLSHNFLTGAIPNSISNLSHLNILDLSFNKLEGKIPNGRVFSNISIPSLIGNEGLCGTALLHLAPCTVNIKDESTRKLRTLKFVLPPAAFVVVLITCTCFLYTFYQRRKVKTLTGSTDAIFAGDHRSISYQELVRATSNFNEANLLGKGRFGSVFRGCLDDGLVIAVKVLNVDVEGALKSFDAECQVFRLVRHRNLVKIISVCSNLDFKALILQFMPNGSLERWLYSNNYFLSLLQRLNIMVDVSLALEHLHYHHPHVVLHCDLKPTNVLLDEEMVGYVSDFGIAKLLLGDSKSVVSASTPGTIGYIAPEYATTGTVSRMSDVYSFGILLLETFTRKKPVDDMFNGESNLREWVFKAYPNAIFDVVDYMLLEDHANDDRPLQDQTAIQQCLMSIIELGLLCSAYVPKERIPMTDVAARLQKLKVSPSSSAMSPCSSSPCSSMLLTPPASKSF